MRALWQGCPYTPPWPAFQAAEVEREVWKFIQEVDFCRPGEDKQGSDTLVGDPSTTYFYSPSSPIESAEKESAGGISKCLRSGLVSYQMGFVNRVKSLGPRNDTMSASVLAPHLTQAIFRGKRSLPIPYDQIPPPSTHGRDLTAFSTKKVDRNQAWRMSESAPLPTRNNSIPTLSEFFPNILATPTA